MSRIGFIGLGMMGLPMAHLMHKAGHQLVVQDIDKQVVDRFVTEHAGVSAENGPASFQGVEFLITMLPNSHIVNLVLGTMTATLPRGCVVIDMSSSDPVQTQELSRRLEKADIEMIDAPVSGGVKKAVSGALAIMVGGKTKTVEDTRPILAVMGTAITHVGPVGAGHALKALNNYVSAAALIATAEAIHTATAFGIDAKTVVDVINASTGKNNTTENKAHQFMLSGAFNSGFSLALQSKDVGIAISLGDALGMKMELGRKVNDMTAQASTSLGSKADHTELYKYVASSN